MFDRLTWQNRIIVQFLVTKNGDFNTNFVSIFRNMIFDDNEISIRLIQKSKTFWIKYFLFKFFFAIHLLKRQFFKFVWL